jgi:hypothetical protein
MEIPNANFSFIAELEGSELIAIFPPESEQTN